MSRRLRVVVADDEPLARAMVAALVREDADVEAVVECADGRALIDTVTRDPADIVFLDIEMPGLNGLQVAGALGPNPPVVVFITAFAQYAAPAFDLDAADYVLKPFSDERFREALQRAKRRLRQRRDPAAYLQQIPVKEGDRTTLVAAQDVLWIEAEDYYVQIHARRGGHLLRASLATLEERLDPAQFVRVHRRALVNIAEVREIRTADGVGIVLSDGSVVPVSRSRRTRVEELLLPRLRSR
jgi:two-component system, LytTR family, response regulator